ncbi:MAG: glycosyltransferase family 1 protein [Desulfobacteraceae bacterium]|jgi:glycosyltransferase involved in cell wall biosynthesis
MKIAFDASCLAVNRFSGLGEFAHHLLLHMPGLSSDIRFVLYINYFRKAAHLQDILYPGTVNHFLKVPRRFIEFLWWFNWMPFDLYLKEIDIFHSIHIHVPPAKKMKTVLTVHDCRYLAFPNIYKNRDVKDYCRQMEKSLDRVDAVVAISEFTRQEILHYFSFPEDRIKVIHYGFTSLRPDKSTYDKVEKFMIEKKITTPYVLVPSALDPRKNLERLIESFAQCKKEDNTFPPLVVVGIPPEKWILSDQADKAKKLDVFSDILMCGVVDREIIIGLIKNAHALCYPSLYEGFGLPPLEAMSLGIPVLASMSSSIPEVSGNAACLVDPLDIDDISYGLRRIVSDSAYRQKLVDSGDKHIKNFSWNKTSAQYLNLYRKVIGR